MAKAYQPTQLDKTLSRYQRRIGPLAPRRNTVPPSPRKPTPPAAKPRYLDKQLAFYGAKPVRPLPPSQPAKKREEPSVAYFRHVNDRDLVALLRQRGLIASGGKEPLVQGVGIFKGRMVPLSAAKAAGGFIDPRTKKLVLNAVNQRFVSAAVATEATERSLRKQQEREAKAEYAKMSRFEREAMALGRGASDSFTMGADNYGYAGLAMGNGYSYSVNLARQRLFEELAKENERWSYMAGQIGGSIPGGPAAWITKAARKGGIKLGSEIFQQGVTGGFGHGFIDTEGGLDDRLLSAGWEGLTGGAGALAERKVAQLLAQTPVARAVKPVVDQMAVNVSRRDGNSGELVNRAVEADRIALRSPKPSVEEALPVDAGGPNVRALAQVLAQGPGASSTYARDALQQRGARLIQGDAEAAVNLDGINLSATYDMFRPQRVSAARQQELQLLTDLDEAAMDLIDPVYALSPKEQIETAKALFGPSDDPVIHLLSDPERLARVARIISGFGEAPPAAIINPIENKINDRQPRLGD